MRLDETSYALARDLTASTAVHLETIWHVPPVLARTAPGVLATRWIDRCGSGTRTAVIPTDRYVVRVFLSATSMRLMADGRTVVNGAIAAGSVHVSLPGQALTMCTDGPGDSLQWYLPASFVRDAARDMDCVALLDGATFGGMYRDSAIEQLALALLAANAGSCTPGTAGHFAIAVLSRLFQLASTATIDGLDPVKLAIPRWRMQRVDAYIGQHLGDPISLAAVAAAAGLSPMHFAARFRLATGQRPHHYILRARIEYAKALLASSGRSVVEVAGDTGFRTQAHFTTIFKRFTGATPCAWRRERSLGDLSSVGADSSAIGC
ncbi:AraC family transcriptional regulator [Luteibacter sp. OK325]|uniref:helix-turn-helix domain-containing protein n=1 Tax=Luteibacter sp. OK325 TaxID=2135670 RepID=UPI000D3A8885|nr:AraC family transcriptional regulator [Luteibacter sp. OK325]PTR33870.1 AraC family transcriptional regulator [Luteibacter sp. OK325]